MTTFIKPRRKVTKVFLHCSATDNPKHDNIETITSWHKQRGFKTIGYHFLITKDGTVHEGRNLEQIPAAQKGHNTGSIAICLSGLNNFTKEQFESLRKICKEIDEAYTITTERSNTQPEERQESGSTMVDHSKTFREVNGNNYNKTKLQTITFRGHCEVSNKSCPNFPYQDILNLDEGGCLE